MIFRPNPSCGVPVYVQLIEQVKHAVETGALQAGAQLPSIRKVAEDLVINPNTVAKAYRELEHGGVIEVRHGAGAFVAGGGTSVHVAKLQKAQPVVAAAVGRVRDLGLAEDEIRRLFEAELRK